MAVPWFSSDSKDGGQNVALQTGGSERCMEEARGELRWLCFSPTKSFGWAFFLKNPTSPEVFQTHPLVMEISEPSIPMLSQLRGRCHRIHGGHHAPAAVASKREPAVNDFLWTAHGSRMLCLLGVHSPCFSTMALFKNQLFCLGF